VPSAFAKASAYVKTSAGQVGEIGIFVANRFTLRQICHKTIY